MNMKQVKQALKDGTPPHAILTSLRAQSAHSLRATLDELDVNSRGTKNTLALRILVEAIPNPPKARSTR